MRSMNNAMSWPVQIAKAHCKVTSYYILLVKIKSHQDYQNFRLASALIGTQFKQIEIKLSGQHRYLLCVW